MTKEELEQRIRELTKKLEMIEFGKLKIHYNEEHNLRKIRNDMVEILNSKLNEKDKFNWAL